MGGTPGFLFSIPPWAERKLGLAHLTAHKLAYVRRHDGNNVYSEVKKKAFRLLCEIRKGPYKNSPPPRYLMVAPLRVQNQYCYRDGLMDV